MARKDLVPLNKRTKDEQKKICTAGGKASGEARRKKRSMKAAAKILLAMQAPESFVKNMGKLGIDEKDATYGMGILVGALQRALAGNINAARYLTELVGEDPALKVQVGELKLREAELAMRQKEASSDSETGKMLVDILQKAWNGDKSE